MRLVELAIRRMPGIHEPFTLGPGELGGGLHVVHGPNGVGKTSLCRAAHALCSTSGDGRRSQGKSD